MASASLSSAGEKPRSLTAAITPSLLGVALAAGVTLHGADRDALVREPRSSAPRGQRREETAKHVGGVGADVPSDFLVVDCRHAAAV